MKKFDVVIRLASSFSYAALSACSMYLLIKWLWEKVNNRFETGSFSNISLAICVQTLGFILTELSAIIGVFAMSGSGFFDSSIDAHCKRIFKNNLADDDKTHLFFPMRILFSGVASILSYGILSYLVINQWDPLTESLGDNEGATCLTFLIIMGGCAIIKGMTFEMANMLASTIDKEFFLPIDKRLFRNNRVSELTSPNLDELVSAQNRLINQLEMMSNHLSETNHVLQMVQPESSDETDVRFVDLENLSGEETETSEDVGPSVEVLALSSEEKCPGQDSNLRPVP